MPVFVAAGISLAGQALIDEGIAVGFGAFLAGNAELLAYGSMVLGGMALSYEQQRAAAAKAKAAYNSAQTDRMANVVTTIGQRELILGRVRKAGTVFGRASTGDNHQLFYMAIALGDGEIDGIEAIYFNDKPVTLDGNGYVTSAPYSMSRRTPASLSFTGNSFTIPDAAFDATSVVITRDSGDGVEATGSVVVPVTGSSGSTFTIGDSLGGNVTYQSQSSDSKARVWKYFGGAGQAVSAPLNSQFGTDWPSTSTATGVAYLVVEFIYDETAFPSGLPSVSAVVRGAKVYDPRTGTTAWSENPALLMRHVLTHPHFGKRASMTAAEDARISAAANACDTSVTYTVGGAPSTRALFTAGTVLPFGNSAKACLDDLAQAMGGSWAYAGGQFFCKAGVYTAPVMALTDADLAVVKTDPSGQKQQQAITIGTHQARASKVNVITPRIWDLAQDYKQVALTPLVASSLVTRDGCWLAQEVTMPAVTYAPQALHVAGITIRDARDPLTVTLPFKMKAYPLELFDSVTLTIARYGWSAKEFMVMGRQWTLDGLILLTLKETASTIFQMDAAFSAQGYAANTNLPAPWTISPPSNVVVQSGPTHLELQADGTVITRVWVSWDQVLDSSIVNDGVIEVQYRLASQDTWHTSLVEGAATFIYIYGAHPGDVGFVQVRTRNRIAVSDWSTLICHTVTGKTTGPGVVTSLTAVGIEHGIRISGVPPTDLDLAYMEVWAGSTSVLASATLQTHGLAATWDWIGLSSADGVKYIWVRAINTSGIAGAFAGPVSATAGITPTPGSVTGLSAVGIEHGIRLSGTLPADQDLGYVEVWESTDSTLADATLIDKGLAATYDRTGLSAASGTRYYWLRCVNTSGTAGAFVGPVSAVAGITAVPGTVTGLTATPIIGGIRLTCTLPSDADLAGVNLYENTVNNSAGATLIATGLTDHYDRLGLLPTDGVHYYWVKCFNTSGTVGAFSAVASATAGQAASGNLASSSVTSAQIASGAVLTAAFASGIEPVTLVTSVPGAKSTNAIFNTTDNKLYRWNSGSGAYTSAVATVDLSGTIADAQIAALAASKITGTLTDSQLAAIAAAKITGQLTTTQITDNSISTAKLQAGSVTASIIAANTITAAQIAAGTITASQIAASTISGANIAGGTISGANIAGGTITASNIAGATITATQLAANSVTATQIAAGAVTAAAISVSSLSAITADLGTVTAGSITGTADINITGSAYFAGLYTDGSGHRASVYAESTDATKMAIYAKSTNSAAIFAESSGADGVAGFSFSATRAGGYFSNTSGGPALELAGPMKTNNSTLVTNLNADLLDGNHASAFLTVGGTAAAAAQISNGGHTYTFSGGSVSGTATATFSGSNKPGANSTGVWIQLQIDGTTYWGQFWPN